MWRVTEIVGFGALPMVFVKNNIGGAKLGRCYCKRWTYIGMFTWVWGEVGFNQLRRIIDWFGHGNAPTDRYMEMPNTWLVIAELIRRPVAFISWRGWNMCFPLLSGPDFSQRTDPLVIARVGDEVGHYIVLTLDEHSPLPHLHPQWRMNRSEAASQWESLYMHRLPN